MMTSYEVQVPATRRRTDLFKLQDATKGFVISINYAVEANTRAEGSQWVGSKAIALSAHPDGGAGVARIDFLASGRL